MALPLTQFAYRVLLSKTMDTDEEGEFFDGTEAVPASEIGEQEYEGDNEEQGLMEGEEDEDWTFE